MKDVSQRSADSSQQPADSLDLLTEEKLAAKLGIAPITLRGWRKRRLLPHIRVEKLIRYSWPRVRQAMDTFEIKEVHAEPPKAGPTETSPRPLW